ncbi:MAG: tyrosine-type recombinase/integrase [Acidimicrobiales bacterium]
MAYIVARRDRFYVVDYDGTDPVTGRERRRWHPAGSSLADAEAIALSLVVSGDVAPRAARGKTTLGSFLLEQWLPKRQRRVRATTGYRYRWMIERYIIPTLGSFALRSIRTDHVDDLYAALLATGGQHGAGLAPKTVHEVHVIMRGALADATTQGLVRVNVALTATPPKAHARPRVGPETWNADQLATFLDQAAAQRLAPALRLAATTGMRRGEIVGLRWSDWDTQEHRLSISRTRQALAGRPTEFGVKTRSSRRCIDLDPVTETHLRRWRRRQQTDGHRTGPTDPMFTNTNGRALHPESISQLFDRLVARTDLPRIRFHDLRHSHASLLVAAGVPIKVVSERLGHAHPGFTMATYQHVLPGMSADAAHRFAALIDR